MAITSSRQLTALRRGLGIGAQRVVMSGLVTAVVRSMVRLRTLETLVALALAIASAHTIALASEAADTLCTIVLASYAAADTLGTVALASHAAADALGTVALTSHAADALCTIALTSHAAANPLGTIALSRALRIGTQRVVMSGLVTAVVRSMVRLRTLETLVALTLAIASAHTIALASEAAADALCTIVLASYAAANPLSTIALSRALRIGAQRIVMSRLVSTVISRVVRLLAWEIPICRLNITSWLKFSLVALALVSRLTYVGFELVVHSDSLLVCLKFLLWKKHSIRASYSFYRKDVYYL
ncbi:hypothetical protein M5W76_06925 [Paenibacillus larvae]|uniref:hypothetical protein n=1 Tax=Paenibacillus larvae TaxID=1464 RepID=UPI0012BAC8E4|nr:hypothetical protein [Paenibacillus larvae]MCY7475951.1 hypothetical protein [Paenibacillus larvae]MCY9562278.1 hypothetical protein [Paenibacillus larvae]MCY9565959.1 hypothetical protein [Paenibacillus larvae]MCY9573168.1 hypothetical protein [Paenibacillus larvae]MCY9701171.1 hypothetical protein [Paenibacillus larvae]